MNADSTYYNCNCYSNEGPLFCGLEKLLKNINDYRKAKKRIKLLRNSNKHYHKKELTILEEEVRYYND